MGLSLPSWAAPVAAAVNPWLGLSIGLGEQLYKNLAEDEAQPSPGSPPTAADIDAQEADKARLRRQRAAAIIAQGRRGTILSGPLGIPGSATKGGTPSGTNTLLGM